jgi:hypothetical protein
MRSGLLHVFRYFGSETVVSGFLPGKGDGKPSFPSLGISLLFYVLAQLGGDKLGDLFHELNGHRDSVLEKNRCLRYREADLYYRFCPDHSRLRFQC